MNDKDRFVFNKNLIKDRVRILRKSKNLTQEQAAEIIGLKDPNSLAKIESYKSPLSMSFDTLIRITNAFEVDPNYFFAVEGEGAGESSHTETLITAMLQDFTEKEKQLVLSIIAAIRANKEL